MLRSTHREVFLSTEGFTKETGYEAKRATVPLTLVDLDELATLVVENCEDFDVDGRALLPLARVYWPID